MALQRPDRPRNNLLQAARERLASPSRSGLPMSRQELADAVNAYLWDKYWQPENLSENDIGKLERGKSAGPASGAGKPSVQCSAPKQTPSWASMAAAGAGARRLTRRSKM